MGITWTSPQRIETELRKIAGYVYSFRECSSKLGLPPTHSCVLVDFKYDKALGEMAVRFNLSESLPILDNGLLTLVDSTLELYSKEKKDSGCSYTLGGSGKETILGIDFE